MNEKMRHEWHQMAMSHVMHEKKIYESISLFFELTVYTRV